MLYLAAAPLCWAGNIVLARGIHEQIPPVAFAFWRWTLAFCLLLPFGFRHLRQDWRTVLHHWKVMGFLSLTGIAGFNTLLYKAVHTTTAINGALIQTAMPAVILVISAIRFRERVTLLQVLGAAMCMVGAAWVVLRGDLSALLILDFAQGDVLMAIAVILYALYSVFLKQRPLVHPVSFIMFTFFLGMGGLMPLYVWEYLATGPFLLRPGVVLGILYVAVFPSIAAYFCWNRGIELMGANRGGLFINLIPVFASFFAVLWLGESLMPFHGIGMLLIFFGMLLFNRKGRRTRIPA